MPVPYRFLFLFMILPVLTAKERTVSTAEQAQMLVVTAGKYHYEHTAVDDAFSRKVYREFIRLLDPSSSIFTTTDIARLSRFEKNIDDQILQRKTNFIDTATTLFEKQIHEIIGLLETLKQQPLDLQREDSIIIGRNDAFSRPEGMRKRWEQWLKYMVLTAWHATRDSADTVAVPPKDSVKTLAAEMISRETCKLQLKLSADKGLRSTVERGYLKSIAAAYDPHTEYMTTVEYLQFQSELSKTSGSFGMSITMNIFGEAEVAEVIPGGPAWRSNAINEGDVVVEVKGTGAKPESFRCATFTEIMRTLDGFGGESVRFTVRKKNGETVAVPLRKELLDVEENIIQSYILEGKKRFGYIYLPSFYDDYYQAGPGVGGCANDMAKELIRLKKESVEGVVLDLRSNGGGSMPEAVRTAGIFIDHGALCIEHKRGEEPKTIKDPARGVVFDGPLVVLVNSYSASASELFAGTLQDYHRAVIVGSPTFGKGTMQILIPVDAGKFDSLARYKGDPPGFLKVTNGCFFRVTGKTHQKIGIQPDVSLPDLFAGETVGEATYEQALSPENIEKKVYAYPLAPLPVEKLRGASESRMRASRVFSWVRTIAPSIPKFNAPYVIPLEGKKYAAFIQQMENAEDSIICEKKVYTVKVPRYSPAQRDTTAEQEMVINDIQEDGYIAEAYNIISDLTQPGKGN